MPARRPPAARAGSRRLENPTCEYTCIYSLTTVYTHLYTAQDFFFPNAISQIGDRHFFEIVAARNRVLVHLEAAGGAGGARHRIEGNRAPRAPQKGDRHRIERQMKRKTLTERHADRSRGDIRHEPPAPQFGAAPLHNLVPVPFSRQWASGGYFLGEACPKCRDGAHCRRVAERARLKGTPRSELEKLTGAAASRASRARRAKKLRQRQPASPRFRDCP